MFKAHSQANLPKKEPNLTQIPPYILENAALHKFEQISRSSFEQKAESQALSLILTPKPKINIIKF